jgi:hypothetical protein
VCDFLQLFFNEDTTTHKIQDELIILEDLKIGDIIRHSCVTISSTENLFKLSMGCRELAEIARASAILFLHLGIDLILNGSKSSMRSHTLF